jgi:serine/threonine protein kinase
VLIYYCVTATLPYKIKSPGDLNGIANKLKLAFPAEITSDCRNVIMGLLKVEPSERLTIPELLCHKWLKANVSSDEVLFGKKECQQDEGEGVNEINVGNIFPENRDVKIAHTDYCSITNDFLSFHQDLKALKETEDLGYSKSFLLKSLQNGDMNHATATYSLLTEK